MTAPDAKRLKTEKLTGAPGAAAKASETQVAASNKSENAETGVFLPPPPLPPLSFNALLELESLHELVASLAEWVVETKAFVDKALL